MADRITVEGEEYISSKKASEATGYAQDYIGQLARRGLVAAKRIGGLWYLSESSLLTYKGQAENYKPQPPRRTSGSSGERDSMVSFDGRSYVSAARAAEITGYNPDYVGQLAREGKVLSRQEGSRWYVDHEGIIAHKKEKDALLAAVQSEAVGLRSHQSISKDSEEQEDSVGYGGAGPYLTYLEDRGDLLPVMPFRSERTEPEATPIPINSAILQEIPEEANPIPIRRPVRSVGRHIEVDWRDIQEVPTPSSRKKRAKLRVSGLLPAAVVATVAIVLSVGYFSLKNEALYTEADPDATLAASGRVSGIFTWTGDVLERWLASEVTYHRPF
jgi:hypothetical protein